MINAMKIKYTELRDAPGLSRWIKQCADESGMSVTKFCAAAEMTTTYYYKLIGDDSMTVTADLVERIGKVVGKEWKK